MSDQEPNFPQEFQEEEIICRSMHHLSTAAHHQPSAAIPPKATSDSLEKYTAGCGNSTKRPPHLSALSSQEPSSKRANLSHASPPSDTSGGGGYTKLPLPISFPVATRSHLIRTFSEPIHYTEGINTVQQPSKQFSEIPTSSGTASNPPPQETSNAVQRSRSFPFQSIQRTVSDPSPFANLGTPPRPPQARNSSESPSCGESPSAKRLKRMKERMKEMSEWWNQVVSEGDEEDSEPENYNTDNIPKEESETEMENPSQEAVWVEKNGDSLVLHFKCPCGNGYQILLFGNNCYYKLTSF